MLICFPDSRTTSSEDDLEFFLVVELLEEFRSGLFGNSLSGECVHMKIDGELKVTESSYYVDAFGA